MEDIDEAEQLYLLEILIEKVTFRKCTLLKYYQTRRDARLPLMVKLNFCGVPPFEISQDAVRAPNALDFGKLGEFNCGESCLFSMGPPTLIRNIKLFPVEFNVLRKRFNDMPHDFIGSAKVSFPQTMMDTVANAAKSQALPITDTYEDTLNIKSEDGEDAGFVSFFARLTCFGKFIITEFKLMKETKSFLFKSATADAPYLCNSLEPGEFPLSDPMKPEPMEGNPLCVYGAMDGPDAGEMLAFGDFGTIQLRSRVQKSLYCIRSGEANFRPSADINSVLESSKMKRNSQNYLKIPIFKCPHVSRKLTGLVTVISPGKPPVLSTERLRGGGCRGEETVRRSKTVTFCGASGSDRPAGPCCVAATSVQRLCVCESCTNTKDVPPPPRYSTAGLRSLEDIVPVTPIICTEDETIDPDMEKHREPEEGVVETKSQDWQKICCCVWSGAPKPKPEVVLGEVVTMPNPPIRYDTTGALTDAAEGVRPVPLGNFVINADPDAPNPPVRYDTTGALSTGPEKSKDGRYVQANPPVRYDTTGVLTAAAGGRRDIPLGKLVFSRDPKGQNPPIRYDTTSALTRNEVVPGMEPKMANPPVRYDTTGALTAAAKGRRPVPLGQLVVNANPEAPNPPVRYDTTSALSPAAVPIALEMLIEGEEEEEEQFVALYEEKEAGSEEASLEELFPQYFVPESYMVQELECAIRRTRRKRKKMKRPTKTKDRAFLPPGVLIGHRNCVEWEPRVPAKQAWLWNRIGGILGLPFQPGWRPGAVRRSVMIRIRNLYGWTRKPPWVSKLLDKPMIPPTLHIAKKKGVYYITMRPMDMAPDDPTPPITFRLPPLAEGEADVWDEEDMSSASSDLEVEFCAPGTCPPEFPPKEIAIQCSLSQGLIPTSKSSTDQSSKKGKGKGKKKK